jgi:hypothetical protein
MVSSRLRPGVHDGAGDLSHFRRRLPAAWAFRTWAEVTGVARRA